MVGCLLSLHCTLRLCICDCLVAMAAGVYDALKKKFLKVMFKRSMDMAEDSDLHFCRSSRTFMLLCCRPSFMACQRTPRAHPCWR